MSYLRTPSSLKCWGVTGGSPGDVKRFWSTFSKTGSAFAGRGDFPGAPAGIPLSWIAERGRAAGFSWSCPLSFLIFASRPAICAFNARERSLMGSAFFLKSPMRTY